MAMVPLPHSGYSASKHWKLLHLLLVLLATLTTSLLDTAHSHNAAATHGHLMMIWLRARPSRDSEVEVQLIINDNIAVIQFELK